MRVQSKSSFIKSIYLKESAFFKKKASKVNDLNMHFDNLKSRRSLILPFYTNQTCKVYNGNRYILLKLYPKHIGHKFGDFVLTKKHCECKNKNKNQIWN